MNKFLKQVDKGKTDLWRWLLTISITFPMIVEKKFLADKINILLNPIYEFLTNYIIPIGVVKYYFIEVIYCFAFILLIKFLHNREVKTFITSRNKIIFPRILLVSLIFSVVIISLISIEIIYNQEAYIFNFKPLGFFELFIIGFFIIAIKTLFNELFFRGYILQFLSLCIRKRWKIIVLSSLLVVLYKLFTDSIFDIHRMIYFVFIAIFFNVLVFLGNGLEIALGVYFTNRFLALVFISETWYLPTSDALFVNSLHPAEMNVLLNYYLPMVLHIVFLVVIIRVFKIKNWKKRLGIDEILEYNFVKKIKTTIDISKK